MQVHNIHCICILDVYWSYGTYVHSIIPSTENVAPWIWAGTRALAKGWVQLNHILPPNAMVFWPGDDKGSLQPCINT